MVVRTGILDYFVMTVRNIHFWLKKKKGIHIGNCWEVVCSLNEIKQGQRYSIGYIGYNPTEFTKKYRKIM